MRRDSNTSTPTEWLDYALSDLELASISPPPGVKFDALCYHCRQAAEKAIKAVLLAKRVDFPPTHNLNILLELIKDFTIPPFDAGEVAQLTPYAIASRYPDMAEPVTEYSEVKEAIRREREVVNWAAEELG